MTRVRAAAVLRSAALAAMLAIAPSRTTAGIG